MSNIVYFTNGFDNIESYISCFKFLKAGDTKKLLVFLYVNEYLQGFPVAETLCDRRKKLEEAGADQVIILPDYLDYLDFDAIAFSISNHLLEIEKERIDRIMLPVTGEEALLKKLSDFLFRIPKEYEREAKRLKSEGNEEQVVLPGLVGKYVEGGEEFLKNADNFQSLKLYHTLRGSYNPVKPVAFKAFERRDRAAAIENDDIKADIYKKLENRVSQMKDYLVINNLTDIYLGTEQRSEQILESISSEGDFSVKYDRLVEKLEKTGLSKIKAQNYLLMIINNYRKIDNTVYMLHGYV